MFNIFKQYKGLRRESYILFFGRTVTSLGSMIQPLLTLILSSKLHFDAASIAFMLLIFSLVSLPATYIAGYLADHYNKRNLIIIFDIVTVISYILCGFIPLSYYSLIFIFVGCLFATMEHPIYDALVADLSTSENRDKAYSLNYLGMNLGFVLAPTIGGLLFENHLNLVFIFSGLITFVSTILIYFYIKDINVCINEKDIYENSNTDESLFSILNTRRIIVFYIICHTLSTIVYNQSLFLLPLNLEYLFGGEKGALIYGTLNSLNAFIVVLATPIVTMLLVKLKDLSKMIVGVILMSISFLFFIYENNTISLYYIHMFIFTLGEILQTLGTHPYMTKRIPLYLRGRLAGLSRVSAAIFVALSQNVVGYCIDHFSMIYIWRYAIVLGIITVILLVILRYKDKKEYPLLYKKNS